MSLAELESTIAADESALAIGKRFAAINIESTQENRRIWRSLLASTEGLGNYISGLILFEESLQPNMVLPDKDCRRADPDEVTSATLKVLKRCVPAAVPSINFLSGGQEPVEATANLNALNQQAPHAPWQLSISYGRTLQQPDLQAWQGKTENSLAPQLALLKRACLNHLAMLGEYQLTMEND